MKQNFTLNNGYKIPSLGLGVYGLDDEEALKTCLLAFKLGYRHIDTAHIYNNERGVGKAINSSSLAREEIFLTSKIWPSEYGKDKTYKAVKDMLKRFNLDYIDLVLLHQQTGNYIAAYLALERCQKEGLIRSIGISNFESLHRYKKLIKNIHILPVVNQLECHPYNQQKKLKKEAGLNNILIESWFPLGHGYKKLLNDPLITSIAKKYGKTNAQIILRWHIENNFIAIPKSSSEIHLKENIDIFDFSLSKDELIELKKLDHKKKFNSMPVFLQGVFNFYQSITILKK